MANFVYSFLKLTFLLMIDAPFLLLVGSYVSCLKKFDYFGFWIFWGPIGMWV